MRHFSGGKSRLWLAVLAQVIATVAMLWPSQDFPEVAVPMLDKWAHFVVFGTLYFLWADAISKTKIEITMIFRLAIALLLYGIIIELIQHYWHVSRTGDTLDVLANAIGIVLGLFAKKLKQRIYLQKG
jgi:VanZ family protein